MVKVLKALAEYHDLSLGDLLEGIVLHAFEGRSPFSGSSLETVATLKAVYGMTYGVEASHRLTDDVGGVEAAATIGAARGADLAGIAATRRDPGEPAS